MKNKLQKLFTLDVKQVEVSSSVEYYVGGYHIGTFGKINYVNKFLPEKIFKNKEYFEAFEVIKNVY